jgi:hypothetical protein
MHEYLASSHERAAFERVRRELAVGGVVGSPVYTLVLRQAGNMAWTAVANCTMSASSVDPCVTVTASPPSSAAAPAADASSKLFSIAVPLRTTMFATVASASSVLLQMRAAFDVAPSGDRDEQASSARSNTFQFTNCGYSARMLYIHVASLDASAPLPSFDLGFYSSPVYDDEVRSRCAEGDSVGVHVHACVGGWGAVDVAVVARAVSCEW